MTRYRIMVAERWNNAYCLCEVGSNPEVIVEALLGKTVRFGNWSSGKPKYVKRYLNVWFEKTGGEDELDGRAGNCQSGGKRDPVASATRASGQRSDHAVGRVAERSDIAGRSAPDTGDAEPPGVERTRDGQRHAGTGRS